MLTDSNCFTFWKFLELIYMKYNGSLFNNVQGGQNASLATHL